MAMLLLSDVQKHKSKESCWIIIDSAVYDVTDFLTSHPGGSGTILRYAGKDATEAFTQIHPGDTLGKYLKPEQRIGWVSASDGTSRSPKTPAPPLVKRKVKLSSIISISDFEKAAKAVLPLRAFAFLATGAEDQLASSWNRMSWKYARFRPRVLRPIEHVDTSCNIMGSKFSVPFFICPAGGAKLANPAGEVLMTSAAAKYGVLHCVCNGAGCTPQEIAGASAGDQALYWQIYPKSDLRISEQEVRDAVAHGYKGFALTVDAICAGKREYDMRVAIAEEEEMEADESVGQDGESENHQREPTIKRPPVWFEFDWVSAVEWLRGITDLPIAIKGIQCWEDAQLCMQFGVHPWLSNHGGRQLDGAPSAIETLIEMRKNCPRVFDTCDVIVDGGIERGADIVKALAMGAKAVGLGRAFLYALVFGEAGVIKAMRILQHEIEVTMSLLGVQSLSELNPSYVDTTGLFADYS
ncbi:Cytochrome b5 domain-containing protein 1 [Neopestalotiopsis sp. 37M]|nr:Cytochrome b5 domain-containing protein 1 [Neopestalotiopsis sp. 37M]